MGFRLVVAGIGFLVCFLVPYGLLLPSAPSDSAPTASPISPVLALLLIAALNTAVVSWLILRSHLRGWWLAATMTLVFYGVQVLQPQVESLIFQTSPGYASHLPIGMIPRIMAAGLAHACLWVPLVVLVLGRWRPDTRWEPPSRPATQLAEWSWKLLLAALAYVVLYFTFGYYVAWRNPAITAYYQGTDAGTFWSNFRNVLRDTPWLPPVQALRGLLWAALALVVIRALKGPVWEKALAVGALFAVVMNAGLLLPNPYMPHEVRMIHLIETASSNFLFGVLLVWLFAVQPASRADARPREAVSVPSRD
jgi:hypothetical protein